MLTHWPEVHPSYNVAPSTKIAAFFEDENGELKGQGMRWGLIPSWSKTFDSKYATFNARTETVADKPSFRSSWRHQQRCLIPMAGYYEWQRRQDSKQPFYISDPNVGGLVAAGLYEVWQQRGEDEPQYSCTMLTRAADLGLDTIHHRMPVLFTPDTANKWLGSQSGTDFLISCETPDIVYWPVGTAVGNVRNNVPELISAVDISD